MAKDVIIKIWCDVHMDKEEKVEARELPPITIEGKTLTVDLCDPCIKEFYAPMVQLMEDHGLPLARGSTAVTGRRPGRQRSVSGSVQCLWCDKDYSDSSSSGLMAHLKATHGYVNAVDAFGTFCAVCGQQNVLMMMAHVNKHHPEYGFTHTAQTIQWAKENGDPHGVYTAIMNHPPGTPKEVSSA
jgi:hypothetical protein